jgi:hypothetical protein
MVLEVVVEVLAVARKMKRRHTMNFEMFERLNSDVDAQLNFCSQTVAPIETK